MILTNIIISSMLMFNSFDFFSTQYTKEIKVEQKKELINPNILINYAISCELIRKDIFDYTKKHYDPRFNYEANPIAAMFWDNNLWELGYLSAITFNYFVANELYKFTNSELLSNIYLLALNCIEFYAITTWMEGFPSPVSIKLPIFIFSF